MLTGPKTIGILGGGQLGRMLAQAGRPMGLEFIFLDPAEDACAAEFGEHIHAGWDAEAALTELGERSDVVTFDFENVPESSASLIESLCPVYPPPRALFTSQDRLREKSLMQEHFNSGKFLDTKEFPKAKLKGKINNISQIDFQKDGVYQAEIEGEMAIKGLTQSIKEKGTVTVKSGQIEVNSKFNITLADYGITFVKGKPSSNIAKTVEVTVQAEYQL